MKVIIQGKAQINYNKVVEMSEEEFYTMDSLDDNELARQCFNNYIDEIIDIESSDDLEIHGFNKLETLNKVISLPTREFYTPHKTYADLQYLAEKKRRR